MVSKDKYLAWVGRRQSMGKYDTDKRATLEKRFDKVDNKRIDKMKRIEKMGHCMKAMQLISTLYNGMLILTGILIMSFAIYVLSRGKSYITTPQDNLFYALLVVMCTGVVVQGFGALGLYSCLTKKWAPNVAYMVILVPVILVQLALATGTTLFSDQYHMVIDIGLKYAYGKYGNLSHPNGQLLTVSIDMMQLNFGCCGNTTKFDWLNSSFVTYWSATKNKLSNFPDSCCNGTTLGVDEKIGFRSLTGNGSYAVCAKYSEENTPYYFDDEGCYIALYQYLATYEDIIIGVGLALFISEIMVLIFGCIFMDQSPRQKRRFKKFDKERGISHGSSTPESPTVN